MNLSLIRKATLATLGAGFFAMLTVNATAATLTFDDTQIDFGGSIPYVYSLDVGLLHSTNGFSFTSSLSQSIIPKEHFNIPDTGTNVFLTGGNTSLARPDGGAFDLLSLRLAEGRNTSWNFDVPPQVVFPDWSATAVQLTGYFRGGGSITTTLTLDQTANENGISDFQQFDLTGFVDLTSVTFTGLGGVIRSDFTLDDLVVTPVPEPSTYALAAIGALGLLAFRRRTRFTLEMLPQRS